MLSPQARALMSLHTRASVLLPHASMPQSAELVAALAANSTFLHNEKGAKLFGRIFVPESSKTTAFTDITVKLIGNVFQTMIF